MSKRILAVYLFILAFPVLTLASPTNGTILNQYVWGENVGWVNFLPTGGDVHITDTAITGYAWDANYGWINLAPAQSGVKNDGLGNLSGHAWSEGGGYINFSGVVINSSGKFTGMATGATYGRITFDCSQCNVTTDWRPSNNRSSTSSSGSRGYILNNITSMITRLFSKDENVETVGQAGNVSNLSVDDLTSGSDKFGSSTIVGNQKDRADSLQKIYIANTSSQKLITIITALVALIILVTLKFVVFKK